MLIHMSCENRLKNGLQRSGATLEPQLINANGEAQLRKMLGVIAAAKLSVWMAREKTEGAITRAKHYRSGECGIPDRTLRGTG